MPIKQAVNTAICLFIAALIAVVTSSLSHAGAILDFEGFTEASQYNAYILEDIEDYSTEGEDQTDIEGPTAVAGDIKATGEATPSLTIGLKLSEQPGYDGSQMGLVVGGSIENTSNTLYGSVWVGGDADLGSGLTVDGALTVGGNLDYNAGGTGGQIGQGIADAGGTGDVLVGGDATFGHGTNTFGSIHANGNVTVNGDGLGDTTGISAGGTFTHNNGVPYLEGDAVDGAPAQTIPDSPIDFASLNAKLKAESIAMAALASNAVTQQDIGGHWGVLLDTETTTAADGDVIVFDLGVDLEYLWKNGFSITGDKNVEIIINVAGGIHTITNFEFLVDPVIDLTNIVFNFFEATQIYLGAAGNSSGIGFKGTIFAPLAEIYFYNGLLEGNLIAKSLTGNGQINWMASSDPQRVPAPSALLFIVAGFFGLIFLWRKPVRR